MGKKFLVYSAFLVGTYLVVSNASNAGKLLLSAGEGASTYARTLQGR